MNKSSDISGSKHKSYSKDPLPCCSCWTAFKLVTFPLWFIIAPLGCIYFCLSLPFRILRWIFSGCKRRKDTPMKVEVVECTS